MGDTATYADWITIKIIHDFFVNGKSCITIAPTRDTHKILIKAGVIIKQSDSGKWLLLKKERQNKIMEEDLIGRLDFCLMDTDPGFYYYTDDAVTDGKPVWELATVGKNGIWKTLTINVYKALLAQKTTIDIMVSSPEKFLEFLIIAKSGNRPPLALREDSDKLVFNQSHVDFPGEPLPAYRFITSKPVALKEAYNYRIQLWEVKDNGESLLSSVIPFPKTTATSVINSKNTISSYFYF